MTTLTSQANTLFDQTQNPTLGAFLEARRVREMVERLERDGDEWTALAYLEVLRSICGRNFPR